MQTIYMNIDKMVNPIDADTKRNSIQADQRKVSEKQRSVTCSAVEVLKLFRKLQIAKCKHTTIAALNLHSF